MAWTTLAEVKRHIQAGTNTPTVISNEEMILEATTQSLLLHGKVDAESEAVKICRQIIPTSEGPLVLTSTVPQSLANPYIIPGTVVVAADALLATVYIENKDYVVNYTNGTVERCTTGSSIPSPGTIYIWYLKFSLLSRSTDYEIDNTAGAINRRVGGTIPDHATVFVDYSHSEGSVTDELIEQAIIEAEEYMALKLKGSVSTTQPDQTLKSAATYYALRAIACDQAYKTLQAERSSASDNIADIWMKLAEKYERMAIEFFSKYVNISQLNAGGILQNQATGSRARSIEVPSPSVPIRRR